MSEAGQSMCEGTHCTLSTGRVITIALLLPLPITRQAMTVVTLLDWHMRKAMSAAYSSIPAEHATYINTIADLQYQVWSASLHMCRTLVKPPDMALQHMRQISRQLLY